MTAHSTAVDRADHLATYGTGRAVLCGVPGGQGGRVPLVPSNSTRRVVDQGNKITWQDHPRNAESPGAPTPGLSTKAFRRDPFHKIEAY